MGNQHNKQINQNKQNKCTSSNCQVHNVHNKSTLERKENKQFYQISEIKGKEEIENEENKDMIYKGIYNYFSPDLLFTKVENKRLNGKSYSIYYAKLECMLLCNDKRYLIAIIPYDMTIGGTECKLSDLKWISFQTITFIKDPIFKIKRLSEVGEYMVDLELKGQNYNVNNNEITKNIIEIEKRQDDKNIYIVPKYPLLQISLFTTTGKNEYANKTTIASALETFNCVLSFI
jgi:hypothetical protein